MREKLKWIILILFMVLTFFIRSKLNESKVKIPNEDDISNVVFINVVNDRGIEKSIIYEREDIKKLLNELNKSMRINKESVYSTPNKDKFTLILFKMSDGGYVKNSIYEENAYLYFYQPFYGIFRLDNDNLKLPLDDFFDSKNKEDISLDIEEIFNDKF